MVPSHLSFPNLSLGSRLTSNLHTRARMHFVECLEVYESLTVALTAEGIFQAKVIEIYLKTLKHPLTLTLTL